MTKKPKESGDSTDTSHPLYDPTKDPTHPFYERDEAESECQADPRRGCIQDRAGLPAERIQVEEGLSVALSKGTAKEGSFDEA